MKKTIFQFLIFLLTLLITSSLYSQIANKLDSIAKVYVSKGFNGNILYSKNDSIVFTGNYGFSNMSKNTPLNDDTIFELASVSKQFTALAIVQLIEKNELSYKTTVSSLIKDFPYKTITIEHLLQHQSGLPESHRMLYNKKLWNRKTMATNVDVINILNTHNLELEFEPGAKYDYNNTGYVILAHLIEKLSGLTYADYIRQHIFKPANMTTSRVYIVGDEPENYNNTTQGYIYDKKKKRNRNIEKDKNHKHIRWMNAIVGDRGIYASILDLEKWKQALRYNKLISEESKLRMFSVDNVSPKYGFGFAIYKTQSKGKWVYHNGSWSGYKTSAIYLPKTNEYLVILSNNRYSETYKSLEDELYGVISNN